MENTEIKNPCGGKPLKIFFMPLITEDFEYFFASLENLREGFEKLDMGISIMEFAQCAGTKHHAQ